MIGIIDYGLGNVQAFLNIYKSLGIPAKRIRVNSDFTNATRFILPGVGSFDHAIDLLNKSGLLNTLEKSVLKEQCPLLGVCVGMQILSESSEEGNLPGLGWIPGRVKKFEDSLDIPLPHMGWNDLIFLNNSKLFKDFDPNPIFYFLHSYYFSANSPNDVIGWANYGKKYDCVVQNKNIYGIQCHPEKSHNHGILLLKNFSEL